MEGSRRFEIQKIEQESGLDVKSAVETNFEGVLRPCLDEHTVFFNVGLDWTVYHGLHRKIGES